MVKEKEGEDMIVVDCKIPLARVVEFNMWILESAIKDGRPTYLPRKWLRESYGILDGVRHLGPRRRAELDALTTVTEEHFQEFVESWERCLGHRIEVRRDRHERGFETVSVLWNRVRKTHLFLCRRMVARRHASPIDRTEYVRRLS